MDTPHPAPLTPEQLAAVTAGEGYALCEDPATHAVYYLIQQGEPPTIDDDYVRAKIEEAYADAAERGFEPWDVEKVKAELHRRLAAKKSSSI